MKKGRHFQKYTWRVSWRSVYNRLSRDTHHYWEDDGEEGGLQDPEDGQADDLNEGEKMDASQRNVAQEGEVRLVFGRHQIQLDPLPELEQRNTECVFRSSVSTNVNHLEVKQLDDTLSS